MTKVVALQTWSNGTITMDEKSVLDIDDALATDLIAKGIVADAAMYFGGGGSGGGVLVVTFTEDNGSYVADKTYEEIVAAYPNVSAVVHMVNSYDHSVYDQYHEDKNKVVFGFVNPNVLNAVLFNTFTINSDNTVTVISKSVSAT